MIGSLKVINARLAVFLIRRFNCMVNKQSSQNSSKQKTTRFDRKEDTS